MKLHTKILGSGEPVLILHGLFGSSDNWLTFAKNLSDAGYMVMAVDLRNHGLSPHSDAFDFEVLAGDVAELISDHNLNNAVVIGHSLGGKTAVKLGITFPQFIRKLIVVDIALRHYPVHHRKIIDSLLDINPSALSSRSEAEQILERSIPDNSTRQFLLKNLYWKEKGQLDWRFNLKAIDKHIENVGEAVYPESPFGKPALFIKGEKSDYINYDDEREIYEYFENVEVATAPSAGHWVHAENPAWLLKKVIQFIKED